MAHRLAKILAQAGIASRRASERLILTGRVAVNGVVVTAPATHADPESDCISVDGRPISKAEPKHYFLLNKPKGLVCSNRQTLGTKRVIDLFSHLHVRLFTVGRLDKATTGLLLVTNDGQLAKRIIHPSSNVTKEYLVKTTQEIDHEHLLRISEGTRVEGKWIRPHSVKKIRRGTLRICVKEGLKHEVRCLVRAADLTLLSLNRVRLGNLRLGNLAPGQFRQLTREQCEQVFS